MAESEIEFIFLGSAPTTSVAAFKFNHLGEGADEKENVIEAALQGQQTFSIKDQIVNILGFAIHSVSMVTTQLHHCSRKAAAKCCISIKSYLQGQRYCLCLRQSGFISFQTKQDIPAEPDSLLIVINVLPFLLSHRVLTGHLEQTTFPSSSQLDIAT